MARSSTLTEPSLGELVSKATGELSTLFRKEIELAKTELKLEMAKAGRGAGMFGGAGFAGYLAVLFLSLAAVFGLAEAMPLWGAALVVAAVYVSAAGVLAIVGKRAMMTFSPAPKLTIQTLKEDAKWARHPTS